MKSLRVDLILETEKRSASPISLKAALRLSAFIVGGVALLGVVYLKEPRENTRRS